ncbi:hypothetical protein V1273_003337 [Bradyrhizobium sp. AZCC 1721]
MGRANARPMAGSTKSEAVLGLSRISLCSSGLLAVEKKDYSQRKAEPPCRVRVSHRNPRATVARSSGLGIGGTLSKMSS